MKINYAKKTITLTKSEMKAAQTYGTDAYKALVDAQRTFPDFIVVVKTPSSKRDNFKGLTRDFMKGYILEHDNDDHSVMAEYNALCGLDDKGEKKDFAAVDQLLYGCPRQWRIFCQKDIKPDIGIVFVYFKLYFWHSCSPE